MSEIIIQEKQTLLLEDVISRRINVRVKEELVASNVVFDIQNVALLNDTKVLGPVIQFNSFIDRR